MRFCPDKKKKMFKLKNCPDKFFVVQFVNALIFYVYFIFCPSGSWFVVLINICLIVQQNHGIYFRNILQLLSSIMGVNNNNLSHKASYQTFHSKFCCLKYERDLGLKVIQSHDKFNQGIWIYIHFMINLLYIKLAFDSSDS